jgi:hypothetical protein
MSSSECRQERFGSLEIPNPWGIAQLEVQKEDCGGETMNNAHLKRCQDRVMD